MGKVTLWMQMSLDGIADSADKVSWPVVDEELYQPYLDDLCAAEAFLYGRRTYEQMASFWPQADEEPAISEFYVDFARCWKKTPKFVISRTLDVVDWNTRVLRGNPIEQVAALKAETKGDLIVFGGPRTATPLMRYGLIDDYHLFIHPIVLGHGTSLFPRAGIEPPLNLIDVTSFPSGVARVHYQQPPAHRHRTWSPGPEPDRVV
ncbi:dihydrofolate reductase family protein [Nocardia sp. NPDC005978]|uniref:dihydrofolate reductase family protein n=1 Tax=Nocardia sp. NPDC005978 TaxID=3156725 RepID=UPI0033BACA3C